MKFDGVTPSVFEIKLLKNLNKFEEIPQVKEHRKIPQVKEHRKISATQQKLRSIVVRWSQFLLSYSDKRHLNIKLVQYVLVF